MTNNTTIKSLPKTLRPYEKFENFGPSSLTNEELLAIIIRTGTKGMGSFMLASKVLSLKNESNLENLFHVTYDELVSIKGIGKVKAIQILCICELSKRMSMATAKSKLNFSKPCTVADYYMETMRHLEVEQLIVIYLDTKCNFISDKLVFSGTVNKSVVSPREIFIEGLRCNAVNVILLHNHPSGDSTPSSDDIISTKRITQAGAVIGINVVDHIIIGDNSYTSLRECGVI